MKKLFILAGEMSGDNLAAPLIEALPKGIDVVGIGGPKMRKAGMRSLYPLEKLQVMGFVDVIAALPRLLPLFFKIKKMILRENPDAVLFVDYPGLNLRLAKSLRKAGFKKKLIHYVCPSVWAWGKGRIPMMEKTLDSLLTLFPFETSLFPHLCTKCVGHPLAHAIALNSKKNKEKILALFPGSRKKVIAKNLPIQLAAAEKFVKRHPEYTIAISASRTDFPYPKGYPLYTKDESPALMQKASFAIATSGTVTLELALNKVPSVVTYAISKLDLFIAQKIFKIALPYYALPNLLLQEELFPELFGPHFTVANLVGNLEKIFDNSAKIFTRCSHLHKILRQEKPPSAVAAQQIVERLDLSPMKNKAALV